jgi:hypothetical protein
MHTDYVRHKRRQDGVLRSLVDDVAPLVRRYAGNDKRCLADEKMVLSGFMLW